MRAITCRNPLRITSPRNAINQRNAGRGSENISAPKGLTNDHKMTALELMKPPRLIINKKGKIRIKNSWLAR